MLGEIAPKGQIQGGLFEPSASTNSKTIAALDAINSKFGRGAIKSAAEGLDKPWRMRRGMVSPAYTTNWTELVSIKLA